MYLEGIYALYLSALVFCLDTEVFVVILFLFTHTRLANNRKKWEISFFFFQLEDMVSRNYFKSRGLAV